MVYQSSLKHREWLSPDVFTMVLDRPPEFRFRPGQRIGLRYREIERDYSLITAPHDPALELCIKRVDGGRLSPLLATAKIGTKFSISSASGHFAFRSSDRASVLVATGTGVAPFVSMVRAGTKGFVMLHGASSSQQLLYRSLLERSARSYIPCLTKEPITGSATGTIYAGRVTSYIGNHLPSGEYDFYLCGGSDMIEAATGIIDDRFPESRVYIERFS